MDVSVVQPTVTKAPVPAGLSSAEASRRLLEYGPNAVVEERVHPVAQVVRHFWAPVPWMLKATSALQIAIGERLEALMIAILLILNVALLGSAHWWWRDPRGRMPGKRCSHASHPDPCRTGVSSSQISGST
jgi:Cation transporter/ATPase, N-terminus